MPGRRLKELRKAIGLIKPQVAAELKTNTGCISEIVSNEKPIYRGHLKMLSVFWRITEDDLLTLWLANKVFDVVKD